MGGLVSGLVDTAGDVVGGIGDIGQSVINEVGNAGKTIDQTVRDVLPGGWTTAALLAAGYYYQPEIAAYMNAQGATVPISQVADAGIVSGATEMTAQQTLAAIGAEQAAGMTAAETLAAIQAEQAAAGAAGGIAGASTGLGTGMATGTGLGALSASQLGQLGIIQGGLGLVGGLLGGNAANNATEQAARNYANLAREASALGKFTPVGTTTRFGTSSFTVDPFTGGLKADYTLSPEAQAYQESLGALGGQGLKAAQRIMGLGEQYVGESPEAVRQRYIETQRAALAPGQEQALAGIRNRLFQTGRGGLATGATEAGGLMATNPEMAAYYNSLANTERQLAANAETAYQNQVNFGTNLLGGATTPFANVFSAQKGVESAAQQPLELSTNLANLASTAGARQGTTYANLMAPSIRATQQTESYSPFATAAMGAASNPLLGLGLMNWYNA